MKSPKPYRNIGVTYDGVRILAPKTKSKRFSRAEVRAAIREALHKHQDGSAQTA